MADAAGQGTVVSPDDLDALTGVYEDIAAALLNQYELTFTSDAFDAADIEVPFEHVGVVAAGACTIELPAVPAEPDPGEEPAEPEEEPEEELAEPEEEPEEELAEPEEEPEEELAEPEEERWELDDSEAVAAPAPPRTPPTAGWWTAPWAMNANLAVFVIGLLVSLLYVHGWRLRDHISGR